MLFGDLDLPFGSVVEDRGVVKSIGFSRSDGSSIDLITHLAERCEIADVTMKDAEIESVFRSIYEHRPEKR